MSFVTVGGGASSSPTFFELVAADRLLPSLKAAISYSLSVREEYGDLVMDLRAGSPGVGR